MPSSNIFVENKFLPPSVSADNYMFNLTTNSFDMPYFTKLTAKEQIIVKSGDKDIAINAMLTSKSVESIMTKPDERRVQNLANCIARLVDCVSDCKTAQKTDLYNKGMTAINLIGVQYKDTYKFQVKPAEKINDDDSEAVKAKKSEQSRQWLTEYRKASNEQTKYTESIKAKLVTFAKDKSDNIGLRLKDISGTKYVSATNTTEALMFGAEALKKSTSDDLETRLNNLFDECSTGFMNLYKPYEAYTGLSSDLLLFADLEGGNGITNTIIKKGLNLFLENRTVIEDLLNEGLTVNGLGAIIGAGIGKLKDEMLKQLTIDKLISGATTFLTVMGVPSNITSGLAKACRRLHANGMSLDVIADISMSLVSDKGDVLSGNFSANADSLVDYLKGLLKEGLKPLMLVETITEKFESVLNSGAVNVLCVAMFALTGSTAGFKIAIWLQRLVRNIKSGISSLITKIRTVGEEALTDFGNFLREKLTGFVQKLVGGMMGFVNQFVQALTKLLPMESLIGSAITQLLSLFGINIVKEVGITEVASQLAVKDGNATAKALEDFGGMKTIYKKGVDFVTGIDFGSVPEGASIPIYGKFGGPNCSGGLPTYKLPMNTAVVETIVNRKIEASLPAYEGDNYFDW